MQDEEDPTTSDPPLSRPPFATETGNTVDIEEDYGPTAALEAFVTDPSDDTSVQEIDDSQVDVLPTRAEVAKDARSKLKLYLISGLGCVVVVVTAIMVPLAFTVLKTPKIDYSPYPSQTPSVQPSQAPTTILFTEYVDTFAEVSNRTLLTTYGTPQYKASKWIYDFDPAERRDLSDPKLLQRYIAAVFYYSTSEGNGWADCYPGDVACTSDSKKSWFSPFDECEWYGISQCGRDGLITRLVMINNQNGEGKTYYGNNLHGHLPSELGYLSSLTELTIVANPNLVSTIPHTFSQLTNLRYMNLQFNELQGPLYEHLLHNMTDLEVLSLDYNNLNITVPVSVSKRRSLSVLGLAGNKLYGKIPTEYGNFHQLERLELHDNQITGEIPKELALPSLQYLTLYNNSLTGQVPSIVCNMKELNLKSLKVDFYKVKCDCCEPVDSASRFLL